MSEMAKWSAGASQSGLPSTGHWQWVAGQPPMFPANPAPYIPPNPFAGGTPGWNSTLRMMAMQMPMNAPGGFPYLVGYPPNMDILTSGVIPQGLPATSPQRWPNFGRNGSLQCAQVSSQFGRIPQNQYPIIN